MGQSMSTIRDIVLAVRPGLNSGPFSPRPWMDSPREALVKTAESTYLAQWVLLCKILAVVVVVNPLVLRLL